MSVHVLSTVASQHYTGFCSKAKLNHCTSTTELLLNYLNIQEPTRYSGYTLFICDFQNTTFHTLTQNFITLKWCTN